MSTPSLSPILAAREMWLAAGVRTDSRMAALSPESFEAVAGFFVDRIPAHKIPALASAELGLPKEAIPGASAMHQFWGDFSPFYSLCSRRAAAAAANALAADAQQHPADWSGANAELIQKLAHEALSNPQADTKTVNSLLNAVLRLKTLEADREKIALAERRVALLESNAAQAKELLSRAKDRGGMTPETQREIEQTLALL